MHSGYQPSVGCIASWKGFFRNSTDSSDYLLCCKEALNFIKSHLLFLALFPKWLKPYFFFWHFSSLSWLQFFLPPLLQVSTPTYPFTQIHHTMLPLRGVGARYSGTSTEYCITSNNKTRHIFSYQGWTRQTSKSVRVPKPGKRVKDWHLLPLLLGKTQEY